MKTTKEIYTSDIKYQKRKLVIENKGNKTVKEVKQVKEDGFKRQYRKLIP